MTTGSPEATMLLITSTWANKPTFKLMPITHSLFVEGIYDVDSKVLVMITTVKKDSFHMVPRINDEGDTMLTKVKRTNGSPYKEERRQLETFQEYYITDKTEIEQFIKMVAINAETYNFKPFMEVNNVIQEVKKPSIIMAP